MTATPPGWFPDPSAPGQLRWWDGERWTEHVADVGPPPPYQAQPPYAGGPSPVAPRQAVTSAAALTAPVKTVLVFAGVAQAVASIATQVQFQGMGRAFREAFRAAERGEPTPDLAASSSNPLAAALANLGSLALLAGGILFLVWLHRAVIASHSIGWGRRWSPGWAVGWWFIPVANFFMPYRVVRDLFPEHDAGRSTVKRWWALWIGASVLQLIALLVTLLAGGTGLVLAALAGTLYVAAALEGRQVVDALTDAQTRAIRIG